jgi:hypothetical protein
MILRQNPKNPCQLLQQRSDGGWEVIFDLSRCNFDFLSSTFGNNNSDKRCNLASMLTEITLPDGMEAILSARENTPLPVDVEALTSTLAAIAAAIPKIPPLLFGSLLTLAAATAIAAFMQSRNTALIRSQLDNAYWLDVKRQLYCTLPDSGILTHDVLNSVAQAIIDNIPNKAEVNQLIAESLRGLPNETAQQISLVGATYEGNSNGCDNCLSDCHLLGIYPNAQPVQIAPNVWRLKVESQSEFVGYAGLYRLPYLNSCCRITQVQVVTPPTPLTGLTILGAFFRCSESVEAYFSSLDSIVGQCVNSFSLVSSTPFEINVTLSESCEDTIGCQLYAENYGLLEALPSDANGDYLLRSLDPRPLPETGGFRRYRLLSDSSCCTLQYIPLVNNDLGQQPTKLRIYECGAGDAYTEYDSSNPAHASVFEDFRSGRLCFNSFAIAPASDTFYLIKVRLRQCDPNCQTVTVLGATDWTNAAAVTAVNLTQGVCSAVDFLEGIRPEIR